MQVLMTVPSFSEMYFTNGPKLFDNTTCHKDAPGDFNFQMAKLANGLLSGRLVVQYLFFIFDYWRQLFSNFF